MTTRDTNVIKDAEQVKTLLQYPELQVLFRYIQERFTGNLANLRVSNKDTFERFKSACDEDEYMMKLPQLIINQAKREKDLMKKGNR